MINPHTPLPSIQARGDTEDEPADGESHPVRHPAPEVRQEATVTLDAVQGVPDDSSVISSDNLADGSQAAGGDASQLPAELTQLQPWMWRHSSAQLDSPSTSSGTSTPPTRYEPADPAQDDPDETLKA